MSAEVTRTVYRLSDGELPADGQRVLFHKGRATDVGTFWAGIPVAWWLERGYDAWEAV